jgi:SAM-dependent methyltransferase
MGVSSIVKVVEHDVTLDELLPGVSCAPGSVDIVTMSYSYSMIPNKKAAVNNINKLLKRDGHLAIADFFLKGNYDDCLSPLFRRTRAAESLFHKNWFAFDHVYLLEDKQLEFDNFETVWDNRFRGAVPFLPFLNPYHGVYILQKK